MPTVRLIHWDEDEGLERQTQLEAIGYDVGFDFDGIASVMRAIKAGYLPARRAARIDPMVALGEE